MQLGCEPEHLCQFLYAMQNLGKSDRSKEHLWLQWPHGCHVVHALFAEASAIRLRQDLWGAPGDDAFLDSNFVSHRDPPNLPCVKKKHRFLKLSQQLFQQPFSAGLLSSSSQQPFSPAILSSAAFLDSLSQHPFSAGTLSYHLAVVKGGWSAINIILLWSRGGGQLLTSSCCGQGLVVSY